MNSLLNKKSIVWSITALSLVLMVGCSSKNAPLSDNSNTSSTNGVIKTSNNSSSTVQHTSPTSGGTKTSNNSSSAVQQQKNAQTLLLGSIKKLAQQGKIINCDFPVKSTSLQDVIQKWGKADKSDWVAQAKGEYTTYSKHNVVFGSNKGDQIFEVRFFGSQLGQLSLSMVKKVFGTPAYNRKMNGEQIIGYTAGKEYKIEFVFPTPSNGNNDPIVNHYSVLYPAGTVNNMSNDPGRKW